MKCLTHNIEVNYPCSAACPLYGDCIASFSQEVKRRVRTNADRIRAMTDEELAEFIHSTLDSVWCPPEEMPCDRDCISCWLAWLQQPHEEGDDK